MLDTVSLLLYTEGTTKKRGIRIMWWDETREKELEMDNRKLRARIEKLGTQLKDKGYRADIGHSSYSTLINIQW